MKTTIATTIAISAFLFGGCASEKYLTVAGTKFRKRGAPEVQIGQTGELARIGRNQFSPEIIHFPDYPEGIVVKTQTIVSRDEQIKIAAEFSGETSTLAKEVTDVGTKLGATSDTKRKGSYKVVAAHDRELLTKLQSPANAASVQRLREAGSRGRIVHEVAIVVSDSESRDVGWSGEGTGTVYGAKIKIKGSRDSKRTVSLSADTVFAYRVARPVWSKASGAWRIVNIIPDDPGISPTRLAAGETLEPKD